MSISTPSSSLPQPLIEPPAGAASPLPVEPLFFIRIAMGLEWSHDSSSLYFESNITGRFNLWRVPASGGWPVQLSVCEERTQLVEATRDGRFLLYTQDRDGNEKPNLFLMSPRGGVGIPLTHTSGVGYRSIDIRRDGKLVAFSAELEGRGQYGVYLLVLPESLEMLKQSPPSPRMLVPSGGKMWEGCLFSPDGKQLAITHSTDSLHNGLCVVDLEGRVREIIPNTGTHETVPVAWSPDGSSLLINSNLAPSGQQSVGLLRISTGDIDWLIDSPWETTGLGWSPDGRYIAAKVNEAGSETLYLLDIRDHSRKSAPLEAGVFGSVRFAPSGMSMAFSYGAANRPNDLWVYPFGYGGAPYQVTNALVGGIEMEDFIRPKGITYPSFDGTPIGAYFYLPRGAKRDGHHPALVMIRGGPTAQTQNRFSRDIQYFVSRGMVVIAPNYRGSTGFGRDFMEANKLDLGGGDLLDIVAARSYLLESGYVDPKRMAVMGGSYGGYLTLMALTKSPELWEAGVAVVPFANWFTEYENEDETLQAFDRMMMGDPVERRDFWIDRSPYYFVDRIRAPLLMLAGGNDIRCPASETREIEHKIREGGGTVEAHIYENEGHGFMKRENSIDAFERTIDFLFRHIGFDY